MEIETKEFREKYAPQMHRTVRWAIREHTLEIIEPFWGQIVAIPSEYYGITPAVEEDVAALFLTYGVGSSILHEDTNNCMHQRAEVKRGISLLMGMLYRPHHEEHVQKEHIDTKNNDFTW